MTAVAFVVGDVHAGQSAAVIVLPVAERTGAAKTSGPMSRKQRKHFTTVSFGFSARRISPFVVSARRTAKAGDPASVTCDPLIASHPFRPLLFERRLPPF
jgi:hypothetical protein